MGGDFYDVLAVGPSRWLLTIGDVSGKGPQAAALTALVRYTIRTEARHQDDPRALLSVLNAAILDQRAGGRFCTVACARLDLSDPAAPQIELACGGHPPPLLVDADGSARVTRARGDLLGVFPDPRITAQRLTPIPGTTLVLYTDGLLEAGAPEQELTPEDLTDGLSVEPDVTPDALIAGLYERAVGQYRRRQRDDIAILAARVNGHR